MNKRNQRSISILGPEEFTGLRLTQPQDHAAGLSAVRIALDHALKEMGLKKSFDTLSKMNQKEGFDCPGCSWPDPEKAVLTELIRFKNPQEFGGILGSGTKLTDLHLQVKINQDVPLLKLVMRKLAELDEKTNDVLTLGGNFLSAASDTLYTGRRCRTVTSRFM